MTDGNRSMATEIQFTERPSKRGVRLEDVLKRIRPAEVAGSGGNPELEQTFYQWQARWGTRQDQISRRLQLLDNALQEDTIAEGAE